MQNLSEFQSGEEYDAQYEGLYDPEIRYLTSLGHSGYSRILDVCCGTGIVTVPLATAGFDLCGVDITEPMLARARAKSGNLDNIEFHLADAVSFSLARRFDMAIMTGNAFQAFFTEQAALQVLQNIHQHLCDKGILVFGTRLLEGFPLNTDDDFVLWSEYQGTNGSTVSYFTKGSRFDSERNMMYYDMKRVHDDGRELRSAIELKFFALDELHNLFRRAGFELLHQFADWDLNDFNPAGSHAVFKLEKVGA